jgi:CAAX protease family protein
MTSPQLSDQRPGPASGPPGGPSGGSLPVTGGDLLLLLIINIGAVRLIGAFIGVLVAPAANEDKISGDILLVVTLFLLLLQALVVVASIRVLVVRKYGLTWADLGLVQVKTSWYMRGLILAILLMPAVAMINIVLSRMAGEPFENPQIYAIAPAGFSWFALIGMLIMGGIVAPIAEEIAFRGVLYPWLRARLGVPGGMVASATCFALLHGVVMLIPALVVVGTALAWIAERSGSILPSAITHSAFNVFMILLLYGALASGVNLPAH